MVEGRLQADAWLGRQRGALLTSGMELGVGLFYAIILGCFTTLPHSAT